MVKKKLPKVEIKLRLAIRRTLRVSKFVRKLDNIVFILENFDPNEKTFKFGPIQESLRIEAGYVERLMKSTFATWSEKPTVLVTKTITQSSRGVIDGVTVKTKKANFSKAIAVIGNSEVNKRWIWINDGTDLHQIKAKPGKRKTKSGKMEDNILIFRENYYPRTRLGKLSASTGGRSTGKLIRTDSVTQKIQPRKFTTIIARLRRAEFARLTQKRIARFVKREIKR